MRGAAARLNTRSSLGRPTRGQYRAKPRNYPTAAAGDFAHPTISIRNALVQERVQRRHLLLIAFEVAGNLLVEMRGADIELVAGGVLADEVGDLVHLGDPAIGLGRHEREAALEPGQHLRLAR